MQTVVYDSASLPIASWTALCDRDPEATVFHEAAWSCLWERVRADARAEWRVLVDNHGQWIGGIPLVRFSRFGIARVYSQPRGAYGGWVGERSASSRDVLSQWIKSLIRPWVGELVITPFHDGETGLYPGHAVERVRYALDLSDARTGRSWESNLRPDMLRNLHVAQKHGWQVERVADADSVERTRRLWEYTFTRHGRRFDRERWRFYQTLYDVVGATGRLFWWVARDDHGPAATIICLHSRERMFYHDGAMDLSRSDGRPMFALFEQALLAAAESGCRTFDFGSGPRDAAGLIRFKEGWGAAPETYCEYHSRKSWWPRR